MLSPFAAATLQAGALSTLSNLCAQVIEAYQENRGLSLDVPQLLRFVCLTFITTPPNFVWQQFLERWYPAYPTAATPSSRHHKDDIEMEAGDWTTTADGLLEGDLGSGAAVATAQKPKFSMRNTLAKWFIDCMTVGAILNTLAFLVIMGGLKGQSADQVATNIRTETIPIIVAGYKIWPIASIISFSFIPVHRRIVFLSFIGLLWGIYMSLVASRV
ncbi:Mpv17 / PMP22 family [Geosmithia morbida]|uniref:Mpv17 / PMP22 family n=1 Tax=Geosmithia morbida TaxID=1094350 RepID=A0A9P4YPS9_9HYPO|nr:Mpv17 / PMP22 family [Geosmithia morbida]KAF4120893.1 Mpv17 / PMP22 family [Geosmithia morbida]